MVPLDSPETSTRRVVRAACPHDCPDTCAMLVTVENGRAIEIKGAPDHPTTGGTLCTKVARYLDRTYSPDRLRYPMRRVGAKGEGRFARISWDEALDEIATRFKAIAESTDGPQAILPYSYAGTMGLLQGASMDRRFFHRLGASLLDRTICAAAGKAGWAAVVGASMGMDVEAYVDSRLILIWGSNPVTSNLHFWTRAQEAKRRGARLVAIDPYRSATADKCHEHIALLPGTDAALALGIMHLLIDERPWIDRDYVDRYTIGFDALAARVREWTPDRVAATCGIPREQVVRLAHDYGTTKPAAIRLNYGMQRDSRRRQRRARGRVPARARSARGAIRPAVRCCRRRALIPVDSRGARAARPDPGAPRTINMSAIGDALLDARDPPVRAIYVYNSNPVAVAPDSSRVVAGFARDDLFCVVHEIFQTDTADYADILLPATTQLEQIDVHNSYGHLYVLANNPAIAPHRRSAAEHRGVPPPRRADGLHRSVLQRKRRGRSRAPRSARNDVRARGHRLGYAEGGRLAAAQRAAAVRAVRARAAFRRASGKCEFWSRRARGAGRRSAAGVRAAARVGGVQSGARRALSAGVALAAGAQLPEFVVRQPAGVPRRGEDAASRHPSRRCRRRAASATAIRCASSTIAAASSRRRASPIARGPASSLRRRSGGASSRPAARTPTR